MGDTFVDSSVVVKARVVGSVVVVTTSVVAEIK